MIQKLKAKANSKKGFTLAELLVVVAIIAVMVAIAVPVFSGAVTKAQTAVLEADTRAAKSEAAVQYLLAGETGTVYYDFEVQKDGDIEVTKSTETSEKAASQDKDTKVVTGTVSISGNEIGGKTGG